MRWVLGYVAALCVLVLVISQSVIIPTFFMPFFRWHYTRADAQTGLDIAETIGISHEDLTHVTTELLRYMRGRRDSLEGITAVVAGRNEVASRVYGQNFFSETEIRHMVDVRRLYEQLFAARNVAFFLLIALVLGMLLIQDNPLFLLARCSREILAGFLAVMVVLAGVIAIDFGRSWDIFHYIFFRGDAANYWRLMPFEDLMINMYPLHFFLHISIFVAVLVVIMSAIIIAAASFYLQYHRRLPGFN
ncbi:MAG: TIGR01906 family membrane protein [Defluviitaleaceae bacterium]|nr:TIGR01906 family membrane protein [Defluviitaleaceae bacterium]MCL2264155.1 TIGR01906 family membrane protein [Defluviitaleaceae bacterium]